MKILLTMPVNVMEETPILFGRNQPLGLMYIASCLEKAGHDVKIIDTVVEKSKRKYIKELKKFCPDTVGISCVTSTIYSAWDTAKIVKQEIDANVFLGGDHVTFLPGESLYCCQYVDYVIRGEGESTSVELVKYIEGKNKLKNIKGLSYRNNKKIVHNPPRPWIKNADYLPYPAWHLVDMYKYTSIVGKSATLISSRGCPQGCSFCVSSRKCGLKWRPRSASSFVNEMLELKKRYNELDNLISIDDNMMLDIKRVKDICKLLIKSGEDIAWFCQGRVDTIIKGGKELMKLMKKSGCNGMQVGVESPNKERLLQINKGIKENDSVKAAKIAEDSSIEVRATYLFGFENENKEEMRETLKFAKELDTCFVQMGLITPFPGTPFFENVKTKLITHDWRRFTVCHQLMDFGFDIEKELAKIFLKFHLRPSFLWRTTKKGLNKSWTLKTLIYPLSKIITGNKHDFLYSFKPNEWIEKSEKYWQSFILKNDVTFEKNWDFTKPRKE